MIIKKLVISMLILTVIVGSYAQDTKTDKIAVQILDRMSNVIGDLEACNFTLSSSYDTELHNIGIVTRHSTSNVIFYGPDKLSIQTHGDKGHRGTWYNGDRIYFYSYDENNYAVVDAPSNTIETIETINNDYGIEFPAADFFFPTFTDDIIDNFNKISYVGTANLDGVECFQILAVNDSMRIQFWIANDSYNLPVKFSITYKKKNSPQYEATFSDWELNKNIPNSIFDFMPPSGAREVKLVPKSN